MPALELPLIVREWSESILKPPLAHNVELYFRVKYLKAEYKHLFGDVSKLQYFSTFLKNFPGGHAS